ncbi:phosphate ABC transporter permease [Sorangium cellulosum]|uniref:Phosphate transport system permease protein PstA n=1 Tax=Sorangium cellulosum TaxID=56 RepID=A0A2L0ERN2_SORCE|nr:phosphate ABC transporter permease PstA [Sorangium cellulosum]AUX41961.1 phosphate ABC transporter permease [Sorangium cellulosum]
MSSESFPPAARASDAPRRTLLAPAPGESLRRARSHFFAALCVASAVVVLIPLFLIFIYVVGRGLSGLSVDFFTQLPKPVGEEHSGMGNAVVGTLMLIGIACCIGLPTGILAGIYLAEVGRGKLASAIRFIADVLGGVPSITIGVFVYALVVVPMKRFSALAGGIALAIVMLPTVTRTTEELLKLVPAHLREASLALGVPEWRTSLLVVLRTASPGIGTGVMLAVARIAGETAPVLLTALGSSYWSFAVDRPIASLPVQIWRGATSPYAKWQQEAWTAALVLILLVFFLNLIARIATSRSVKAR